MAGVRLHGRQQELQVTREALSRAAGGDRVCLIMGGQPGMGKTTLLEVVEGEARAAGFTTFLAHAEEWSIGRPFAALRTTKPPLQVESAVEGDTVAALAAAHYRLIDAYVAAVEQQAVAGPVAVLVDDVQWADAGTLAFLAAATDALDHLPVFLCATHRPLDPTSHTWSLVRHFRRRGATEIQLGPLDDTAAAAMAADVLGEQGAYRVEDRLRACGGNPFFLKALLSATDPAPEAARGSGGQGGAQGFPSLAAVLTRHVADVAPEAIDLLRVAAVLGPSFAAADLLGVLGASWVELLPSLERASAAGLLDLHAGDSIRFRHDLVREAISEDTPPAVKSALHDCAWRVLAARGAPAVEVAHHVTQAATATSDEAAEWLRRAADEIGAPATAIELLRKAQALSPSPVAAARLVQLVALAENSAEAETMARQFLALEPDSSERPAVHRALVHSLFAQGKWDELVGAVGHGVSDPGVDPATRVRLMAERVLARSQQGQLDVGEREGRAAIALAATTTDPAAAALPFAHLSVIACNRGRFEEAVQLATQAVEVAAPGPAEDRVHVQMALGMALFASGDLQGARCELQAGRRMGEAMGSRWDQPLHSAMLGLVAYHLGEWQDAVAEAEAALELAVEVGAPHGSVTALAVIASVSLSTGDAARAEDCLRQGWRLARDRPQWGTGWLMAASAQRRLQAGAAEAALDLLGQGWEFGRATGSLEGVVLFGPLLARAAARHGRKERAREVASELASAASGAAAPYVVAAVRLTAAVAHDDAEEALVAAELYRGDARPMDMATALTEAACSLSRRGDLQRAREAADEALQLFRGLGASADARYAVRRLRQHGLRLRPPPRQRPTFGWEALTKSELEIARLAAQGLTNPLIGERLFISRRTVQTHLAHIFSKLGISSRVELAREVLRREG